MYGIVAAGDVTVDNTVHHHGPVYMASAGHNSSHWWTDPPLMGLIILAIAVIAMTMTLALADDALHFAKPTVPMTVVSSSAIKAVGYDSNTQHLFITFTKGKQAYTFCNVPAAVHVALMAAPSKGGFYNEQVRGRYGC